jgi:hypothetical protein
MQIFIISWPGKHTDARAIADDLIQANKKVAIVYSDENPDIFSDMPCDIIPRPNNLFWADKFSACLENLGSERMLVIHADCSHASWAKLADRAVQMMDKHKNIGVWSPHIQETPFHLDKVKISEIQGDNLSVVTNHDGLVFALSSPVVERMKKINYSENIYGWGIDFIFSAYVQANNLLNVVDTSIKVTHPLGAGYDTEVAGIMMEDFLQQLTPEEKLKNDMIRNYHKRYEKLERFKVKMRRKLTLNPFKRWSK